MAITALPDPPSRAEPANFSTKADTFLGALPTFADECNAVAEAMDLNDTASTSTTSVAIGTGAKSLTVDASKSYLPGMYIQIARTSDPDNWMNCRVTSYNSGTGALVAESVYYEGTGTFTDWTVSFSAPVVSQATYSSTMTGNETVAWVTGLAGTYIYDPDGSDRLLTTGSGFLTGFRGTFVNSSTVGDLLYLDGVPLAPGKHILIYDGSNWI